MNNSNVLQKIICKMKSFLEQNFFVGGIDGANVDSLVR